MTENPEFTPPAARRWVELGGRTQTLLLNNVWCGACSKATTIVHFTGRMKRGDLVLKGRCIRCDGSVARVIEGSHASISTHIGSRPKIPKGDTADTWVTDMRHFLDETGDLGELPNQALNLALYVGSIVAWMTGVPDDTMQPTNVTCRRTPKRRRCVGEICARFEDDSVIAWLCPLCGDNGFIRGWEGTPWDRGARK